MDRDTHTHACTHMHTHAHTDTHTHTHTHLLLLRGHVRGALLRDVGVTPLPQPRHLDAEELLGGGCTPWRIDQGPCSL
jgi:hypothetical protein